MQSELIADSRSKSQAIYEHAARYIPGGVSSSNRLIKPNDELPCALTA